jgi:hypothetical protein
VPNANTTPLMGSRQPPTSGGSAGQQPVKPPQANKRRRGSAIVTSSKDEDEESSVTPQGKLARQTARMGVVAGAGRGGPPGKRLRSEG